MTTETNKTKKKSPLGRVTALGPKLVWQSALLLPKGWDDLRFPVEFFNQNFVDGDPILIQGRLDGSISTSFRSGTPRMFGAIIDRNGYKLSFNAFGDTRELQAEIEANKDNLIMFGQVSIYRNEPGLKNIEVVDPRWIGRMRPRYQGKPRVITPETVRERVVKLLREAIPKAADEIAKEMSLPKDALVKFADDQEFLSLERIILHAHLPKSVEQGLRAQKAIELISAWRAIKYARDQFPDINKGSVKLPKSVGDWREWANQLPFELSPKQQEAIDEIVNDLRETQPMRRLLSGDVGYGKTAVFATAAATIYAAGGRVGVLLPNETLAEQCYREIKKFWPQLGEDIQLATGSTDKKADLTQAKWLVGTTALLFRETGKLDLVVVDEQQKFSREQREALLQPHTHLLEATATCIPRSQALMQFGGFKSTILDVPPIPRTIHTKIRQTDERRQMFQDVKETLSAGNQVLFVYPRKGKGKDENEEGIHDVEAAAEAWEKLFPGQVRIAHSERTETQNEEALRDMREEKAKVLISTTVVEVGVNIPMLRRVVIVHPHRFGLSTLHQIRGRVARTGGIGYCDLFLPVPAKPASLERLQILERTQNGFEVAREDLMIRGCGNLKANSSQQTGADETILFGRPLTPDLLEAAIEQEKKYWT